MAATSGNIHQVLKEKERVLQEEVDKFRTYQKDIQKAVLARKQLDGQLTENKNVKEELDLSDGNVVYKMIGPILVKQELSEAKQNVDKRLQYITKELERTDKTYKELEQKQEKLAEKLSTLQQDYQQTMVKAGVVR